MSSSIYDKLLASIHAVASPGNHTTDYRALQEMRHSVLLKKVSAGILYKTLTTTDLDPERPITVIGPSTIGALMVDRLSKIPELRQFINFRALMRIPRQGYFAWNQPPHRVIDQRTQVIWVNDVLTTGHTFEQTRPMIEAAGGHVHTVGIIKNNSRLTAADLNVPNLVALETMDSEVNSCDRASSILCESSALAI